MMPSMVPYIWPHHTCITTLILYILAMVDQDLVTGTAPAWANFSNLDIQLILSAEYSQ